MQCLFSICIRVTAILKNREFRECQGFSNFDERLKSQGNIFQRIVIFMTKYILRKTISWQIICCLEREFVWNCQEKVREFRNSKSMSPCGFIKYEGSMVFKSIFWVYDGAEMKICDSGLTFTTIHFFAFDLSRRIVI